jgi:hypothetical protein
MRTASPEAQPTASRSRPRRWILDPIVRGATGLPLALAAIPMAVAGLAGPAARLQIGMAARFPATGAASGATGRRPGAARVLGHSFLVLVPAALAFAATAMQLFLVYSGYLYPVRPDTIAAIGHPLSPDPQVLSEAWGGPTLMGAWGVHFCVALGIQALCGVLLVGLCTVQNRCTGWLASGAGRRPGRRTRRGTSGPPPPAPGGVPSGVPGTEYAPAPPRR